MLASASSVRAFFAADDDASISRLPPAIENGMRSSWRSVQVAAHTHGPTHAPTHAHALAHVHGHAYAHAHAHARSTLPCARKVEWDYPHLPRTAGFSVQQLSPQR